MQSQSLINSDTKIKCIFITCFFEYSNQIYQAIQGRIEAERENNYQNDQENNRISNKIWKQNNARKQREGCYNEFQDQIQDYETFSLQNEVKGNNIFRDELKDQNQLNLRFMATKKMGGREPQNKIERCYQQLNQGDEGNTETTSFHYSKERNAHSHELNKINFRLHQVLYSSDLMSEEEVCQRCLTSGQFFYDIVEIGKYLFEKYSSSQNYFYSKDINEILVGDKSKASIDFKDYFVIDEEAEYLKKLYTVSDYKRKSKLLSEYYKFHKDIPRLFMLPTTLILNNYHNKRRKYDYYRIAKLIEEENKMNPQRPPKEIAGNNLPMKTNETSYLNDEENKKLKKKKKNRRTQGEKDDDSNDDQFEENEDYEQSLLLKGISSFINKEQYNPQQSSFIKNNKEEEGTILKDLYSKLENIVSGLSQSSQSKSCTEVDESIQFNKAELDNFLVFLSRKESLTSLAQQTQTSFHYNNPRVISINSYLKPSSVSSSSAQFVSQQDFPSNTPRDRETISSSHQGQIIKNIQQKQQEVKVPQLQSGYIYNLTSQNQCGNKFINNQLSSDLDSQNINPHLLKKKNDSRLRIDDIDCFTDLYATSSKTSANVPLLNFHQHTSSVKSIQRLYIGNQNPLSFKSARDQYPQTTTAAQLKQVYSSKEMKTKINSQQHQSPYLKNALSYEPSKLQNLNSQMHQTNSASQHSLNSKIDLKQSQLITTRSPPLISTQSNAIILHSQQSTQNPDISQRESHYSKHQLPFNVVTNNNTNSNLGDIENLNKVGNSNSTQVNSSQVTQSQQPLSKNGWKHLNINCMQDQQNQKGKSNNISNLKMSVINSNSNNSLIPKNKESLSQRTYSSQNSEKQASKFNYYDIFKQQMAIINVNNNNNNNNNSSSSNNLNGQSIKKNPSATVLNVMQLISAQQAQQDFTSLKKTPSKDPPKVVMDPSLPEKKDQLYLKQFASQQSPKDQKYSSSSSKRSAGEAYSSQNTKQGSSFFQQQGKSKLNQKIQMKNVSQEFYGNSLQDYSAKLSSQKRISSQKSSRTESNALKNIQIKPIIDKSQTQSGIGNREQCSNTASGICTAQSKQVSRNSSLDMNCNQILQSKKSSLPQKEIKSVYNFVQQLASDGIQIKQTTSARNYQPEISSSSSPVTQFVLQDSQLGNPSLTASLQLSSHQNQQSIYCANNNNNTNMTLSAYHQSKISQQLAEFENRDSGPSTTAGKSNNTSSQQHSICGTNNFTNFKNFSGTNGSMFSLFNASSPNINSINHPQMLLPSSVTGKSVQQQPKPISQFPNQLHQPTSSLNGQQAQNDHSTNLSAFKKSHNLKEQSQISKHPSAIHKHTKSETSANFHLEGKQGKCFDSQTTSPSMVIPQMQNIQFQSLGNSSSSLTLLESLRAQQKSNMIASSFQTCPFTISTSTLPTQPVSPRQTENILHEKQQFEAQQPKTLFSHSTLKKQSQDSTKNKNHQSKINLPSTHTQQSLIRSSIQSPQNNSTLIASLSGSSQKPSQDLQQKGICQPAPSSNGNSSKSASQYQAEDNLNSQQGFQCNQNKYNKQNNMISGQNPNGIAHKTYSDQMKKSKKKSMW